MGHTTFAVGMFDRLWQAVFPRRCEEFDDKSNEQFADAIANILRLQMIPTAGSSVESANGIVNGKAMGYIYGFIDAALRNAGQDMSDASVGIPITFQILRRVFPGKEEQYLAYLLDHVPMDKAVMLGVMCGGRECLDWMAGKRDCTRGLATYILKEQVAAGNGSSNTCIRPKITLWTWQGVNFAPPFYPVDRSNSGYLTHPACHSACPDIRRAYDELDELLALPADRKGQFIWCYTTKSWDDPQLDRRLWTMEVSQESILAYVCEPIWEHLIGSRSVPQNLRWQWQRELWSRQVAREQFQEEISRREREYYDSFPSRIECLKKLLSPTGPGDDLLALVSVPVDASCIRPDDVKG